MASILTRAGAYEHAERVARTITHPRRQAHVLADLAAALVRTAHHQHATRLATDKRLKHEPAVKPPMPARATSSR